MEPTMREYDRSISDEDWDNDEDYSAVSAWLLNFVLGLLGATVIGLAFFTLRTDDDRYLYNPWTYVVLVPVALVLLSAVLSTLVSRLVQRSMQAAFLLSVLAHLLILTGLSNIIIHSRMWPQLFDSFAQQRQKLKLEALHARQYVKVSVNTQPSRRPDHLRYVPTEHQATEIPQEQNRNSQLVKNEANLVSPKINLEKTSTAHLIQRANTKPTNSATALEAAELSRSQLSQLSPDVSSTPVYEIFQSEPKLEASRAESLGARSQPSRDATALSSPDTLDPAKASAAASSAASIARKQAKLSPTELIASNDIPRASTQVDQPRTNNSVAAETLSSAPQPQLQAAVTQAQRAAAASRMTPAPALNDSTAPSRTLLADKGKLNRKPSEYQLPNPSDGDSSLSLARSSAGGETGPAARSSLPTLGNDLLASSPTATGNQPSSTAVSRKSASGKQSLAELRVDDSGVSAANNWDGAKSLSGGLASRSPSQLASAGAGQANSESDSGLTGSGTEVQRAAIGQAGPQQRYSLSTTQGSPATEPSTELRAGDSSLARDASPDKSQGTLQLPGEISGNSTAAGPTANLDGQSLGIARNNSVESPPATDSGDVAINLPKASQGTASAPSKVDSPQFLDSAPAFAGQPLSGEGQTLRRQPDSPLGSRMQIPLEIDASPGAGGVGTVINEATALLPRRTTSPVDINLPALENAKIDRSDIGGRLGAGSNVAMPTKAFQQRLDRLQNRSPDSVIDPRTELAIERGLEFLARYQRPDGRWRLQDFDTEVLIRSDTAATALAILAFQGAGYTHVQSKYASQVKLAIEFLAKNQKENGDLYIPQDPVSDKNAWLYSHAMAALALSEAYGMTQDERLKPIAQRSIDFVLLSQDPKRGGWRYTPGFGSDTSVSGWYMMALQSARLAGLNVPSTNLDSLSQFIEQAQVSSSEPHLYRYNPFASDTPEHRHGLQPTAVMTSVGLLIRLYLSDWKRDRTEMIEGASYLLINYPQNGDSKQSLRDTYYWYYATQVIFHMGGDYWKRWHDRLNPMLIQEQVISGRYAGSWDPNKPVPDLWARYGGRLYVTTMNLLSLEVSYRHLPLYDATAQ
jgi:hypothetical protein